ncbi:MAG: diguanylate cyclase/phosphodiesterase with FHA and GAF sensor [uncultured bacterium]|nr:MAG: diguanylate cyclase/phosphodiesterase with FHA and GAF sensor [uncultured bacterium]
MLQLQIISAVIISAAVLLGFWYVSRKNKILKQQLAAVRQDLLREREHQTQLTTNLRALQEKISYDVLIDLLTGLPSRKLFEDRLALTVQQSIRHQLTCSVMCLDLDGFKMINDALGHDMGDLLLKEVAARLSTCVRQVDTLSRFAGDEFVFIFSQIAKAETAAYLAQRLLDAISQPFLIDGQELYTTASIGIAVFPLDGHDGKTLLKNADLAMHQAKSRGRNTYQFYHEEMHTLSRRELMLTSSLHSETVYQEFSIYYQPQFNIETKQVVCMEAFLQWQQPDFGVIEFSEFIKVAENSGRMVAINEWLLRNACQQMVRWQEQNFIPPAIAVKISLKQLENAHFVHKLSQLLQEMRLDPSKLILEITEASLLSKIEQLEKMLHMLKHLGVQIAVNHFGAGYLPLCYLRRLPLDIFKIDTSLIHDIAVNKESEAIVKMIIALAKSLQAKVIAEGVESQKQKKLLHELGCMIMQGQLFSRPSLAHEFTASSVQNISENV